MSTARWAAGVAGVVGAFAVGRLSAPTAVPPAPPTASEPADCSYTEEELRIACLPVMRRAANTLEEVQVEVEALAVRIRAKESEVAALEARQRVRAPTTDTDSSALALARAELAELQARLDAAMVEKVELELTLATTQRTLEATRLALTAETRRSQQAEQEAVEQRWQRFLQEGQLLVCTDGTPATLDRCRQAVASALRPHERRFKGCVASGQAVPEVRRLSAGEAMPSFAVALPAADRALRDTYIAFCDPSLPEAGAKPEMPQLPLDGPPLPQAP